MITLQVTENKKVQVADAVEKELKEALTAHEKGAAKYKALWPKVDEAFGPLVWERGTPEHKACVAWIASLHPRWCELPPREDTSEKADAMRYGRKHAQIIAAQAMSLMLRYRAEATEQGEKRSARRNKKYSEVRASFLTKCEKFARKGDPQATADLKALKGAVIDAPAADRIDIALAQPRTVGAEAKLPGPVKITRPAKAKVKREEAAAA